MNGVFKVADPRGLPWQNPTAHGTAKERFDALITGTDIGMNACMNRYGPGFSH